MYPSMPVTPVTMPGLGAPGPAVLFAGAGGGEAPPGRRPWPAVVAGLAS